MANAGIDANNVPTILCTSDADGVTTIPVKANASTHVIMVDDDTTGTDLSGDVAPRDENLHPAWLAVSETDGVTPVPIYANIAGSLLVDSS